MNEQTKCAFHGLTVNWNERAYIGQLFRGEGGKETFAAAVTNDCFRVWAPFLGADRPKSGRQLNTLASTA